MSCPRAPNGWVLMPESMVAVVTGGAGGPQQRYAEMAGSVSWYQAPPTTRT